MQDMHYFWCKQPDRGESKLCYNWGKQEAERKAALEGKMKPPRCVRRGCGCQHHVPLSRRDGLASGSVVVIAAVLSPVSTHINMRGHTRAHTHTHVHTQCLQGDNVT